MGPSACGVKESPVRIRVIVAAYLVGMRVAVGSATPLPGADPPSPIDTRLAITLQGQPYDLAARVFRPPGAGPFPLVVVNHGTPADKSRLPARTLGFTTAAEWFVRQGAMVAVVLRPGFGSSSGPYLEGAGGCGDMDFVAAGRKTAAILTAIVTSAARLPGVDPRRIVVVGQSAGGFGAIAMADAPPAGVLGIVSFAGGRGSNGREFICAGEDKLVEAARQFGQANRLPQLWLYAANDRYFVPALAHRMMAAYAGSSAPPVTFVDLPAFAADGHETLARADPSVWAAPVSGFLGQIGATSAPRPR